MSRRLPIFKFEGTSHLILNYCEDFHVRELFANEPILGFDMDWERDSMIPSVIHLSSRNVTVSWLMHDAFLRYFPPTLCSLLSSSYPRIIGFGMKCDNMILQSLGVNHQIIDVAQYYPSGKLRELAWLVLGINYEFKSSLTSWKNGIDACYIPYSVCDAWLALMLALYYFRMMLVWSRYIDPIKELKERNGRIDCSSPYNLFPWMREDYEISWYYGVQFVCLDEE